MLDILKIIYQFENHAATTLEISLVREKLGYPREKSYNSLIVQSAKRVKEYLKKDALINEDDEEIFWGFFFDGEYLKGKGVIDTEVKVGKSFDSGGWSLSRTDLNDLIPIDEYEGNYPIVVDGISTEGRLNLNTRLFYKGDELRSHLEDLFNENPNQKIPIQIEYKDENKRGFQFKLKKELIEAIETLYDNLEVKYPHSLKLLEEFDEGTNMPIDEFLGFKKDVSFYDYLTKKGYLFDKETIENYLLSLKVKPFAILTGNSGTGKTKLSQLFVQYLMENSQIKEYLEFEEDEDYGDNHQLEISYDDNETNEYITFKDKSRRKILGEDFFALGLKAVEALLGTYKYYYTIDAYIDGYKLIDQEINFQPFVRSHDEKLIKHLNCIDDLKDIEIKINKKDFLDTFLDQNSIEKKKISFERKMNGWQYWIFPNTEWGNIIRIKKESSWRAIVDGIETTFDFGIRKVGLPGQKYNEDEGIREILDKKDMDDYVKIEADLSSIKRYDIDRDFNLEEEFGLVLINDNEKVVETSSNNVVFEEIEKNKSHQSNYKIIPVGANWTENRHIVGYYNVITNEYQSTPAYDLIKEANNSTEPYFLILDEMNLSHVERYFADFLSAIESGEKIPLYGEEELTLPENLFIIGTVNVDETTYMFSPKVLDRANVIEFETYSASDYMNDNINLSSPSGNIEYLENPLAGNEIRSYGIDELREIFSDVTVDDEPFWDVLSYEINSFQTILSKSGFDFGFRVINEIVRFMAVAWEYEGKPSEFANWTRYFDACIKQKMLPKLHGSEKIIGETLEELSKSCSDSIVGTEDMVKYPESFKKLEEMKKILRKQRYVSFIN